METQHPNKQQYFNDISNKLSQSSRISGDFMNTKDRHYIANLLFLTWNVQMLIRMHTSKP